MNIIIFGGDGYLGWPTAMNLAEAGHDVTIADNYIKRTLANKTDSLPLYSVPDMASRSDIFLKYKGIKIHTEIIDCANPQAVSELVDRIKPEAVIHYAEQASAPYSMMGQNEARFTLQNNLDTTFNIIWAIVKNAPECHIIKLGTMGEYGTPNIDIEEGWIEIDHNDRKETFLYPRQAGSFYHTTKILDTDMLWFYVRLYNLKVTDLMQGPVYGIHTPETLVDESLMTTFHYDDIFGTVLNRFIAQAVADVPLTVYGKGGQTRGFINILDTLQCVKLAIDSPVEPGKLRILNQFTEQFDILQLADMVRKSARGLGIKCDINCIENPRNEKEKHYYNAKNNGLGEMGLIPNYLTDDVITGMLQTVQKFKSEINKKLILPRVSW